MYYLGKKIMLMIIPFTLF